MHQWHSAEHALKLAPLESGALSETPNLRATFDVARGAFVQGDVARARDILRTLLLAAPGEPDVWEGLARCHDALGQAHAAYALRTLGSAVSQGQFQEEAS